MGRSRAPSRVESNSQRAASTAYGGHDLGSDRSRRRTRVIETSGNGAFRDAGAACDESSCVNASYHGDVSSGHADGRSRGGRAEPVLCIYYAGADGRAVPAGKSVLPSCVSRALLGDAQVSSAGAHASSSGVNVRSHRQYQPSGAMDATMASAETAAAPASARPATRASSQALQEWLASRAEPSAVPQAAPGQPEFAAQLRERRNPRTRQR